MWESESVSERDRIAPTNPNQLNSLKPNDFERRDQSWYVAGDIPADLLVKVGGVNFHLHKYPLLARSGRMNRIIYESSRESEVSVVDLKDMPGGPEAFEMAAKFCYGVAVDLTASNISGLRCAAEYLEMTEDLEEGNLIFKAEAFLSYVVLSSWRDSIIVLKSCESLSPWAENLQIVRRCSESIAWKACSNPKGVRWAYTGRPAKSSSPRYSSSDQSKDSSPSRSQTVPPDWWFEDVSILRIDHFVRVVTAIKVKGMRFDLIGAAIVHYASKWLPGLLKDGLQGSELDPWHHMHLTLGGASSSKDEISSGQIREQRMVIESLISIIPQQKDCVSCSFLLKLLRQANMLNVAPALVTELEKRVGMQLDQAALNDLLIPTFNRGETLYDVDLVQRLVEHFLVQEQIEASSPGREPYPDKHRYDGDARSGGSSAMMKVARLLDSYLTEVSRDRNLSLTKFQVFAEALPESARTCDDGLYRAVDSYLKAHPTLTEHERKRLCRVMDTQKLSMDACLHAAQNERLPLRVVMQVLFSEQVKLNNVIANSSLKDELHQQPAIPTRRQLLESTPQSFQDGWSAAKKDINTLKFELQSMKAKYSELQSEMDSLQRQMEKITVTPTTAKTPTAKHGWSSGWKKLGKLAKMGNEVQEGNAVAEPVVKKAPRRWRNSIS